MTDTDILEAPGFRGRITGKIGDMAVIDAEVTGDIPAHIAESDEFGIVLSGRFRVKANGETRLCGPGDYMIVPAGTDHTIEVEQPGRLILIGKT